MRRSFAPFAVGVVPGPEPGKDLDGGVDCGRPGASIWFSGCGWTSSAARCFACASKRSTAMVLNRSATLSTVSTMLSNTRREKFLGECLRRVVVIADSQAVAGGAVAVGLAGRDGAVVDVRQPGPGQVEGAEDEIGGQPVDMPNARRPLPFPVKTDRAILQNGYTGIVAEVRA